MGKILIILSFALNSCILYSQKKLIIEETVVNDTSKGQWLGVNIPRRERTAFTYRNNSITSVNNGGYMLQAGDEEPGNYNNNLDGEVITGNKFTWNGTDLASITHGLFVGYNINSIVKYNYLDKVPYGIIFKSGTNDGVNMTFATGGCAYNICKNGKFAVRLKGINGVKIYNNTFYSGDGNGWYLVFITENMDRPVPTPSTGSKIFNNIFYSTIQIPMIKIESGCLTNFESDYNIFWCEAAEPIFMIDGVTRTFAQWQALGYDTHSIVMNPHFKNLIDFVPNTRLDYGINLGTMWQTGLSVDALWGKTNPDTTIQNGKWQVGARVLAGSSTFDTIGPTVSVFAIPTTATSLVVPITTFTATDAVGVTGYLLTETSSSPNAGSGSWTSSAPTTYTFSSPGSRILYAWAKDAAGNVSASAKAIVTINGNVTESKIKIYPNPAYDFINISIKDSTLSPLMPLIIKIIDLSGKIILIKSLEQGIKNVQIPKYLGTKVYIITMESGDLIRQSQKLIINH
jgi:hypothetical protein